VDKEILSVSLSLSLSLSLSHTHTQRERERERERERKRERECVRSGHHQVKRLSLHMIALLKPINPKAQNHPEVDWFQKC
jgi:hypothetical protein